MEYRLEGSDVVILAVAVWFVGTFINNPVEFLRRYSDLPPRTIPLFKLDRTPLEGRADTAGASM